MPRLHSDTLARLCRARDLLTDLDRAPAPTVAQVAERVGVPLFHFCRRYRQLFGRSPHDARTHARLERAKELLARGTTVTETCLAVGFSSVGSFSALFRRRIGETPTQYALRTGATSADERNPACLSLMARVERPIRNPREA